MKALTTVFLSLFFTLSLSAQVDHAPFNELLKKHVSSSGNVNYKGFIADKRQLETYLGSLSKEWPLDKWSKNEQLSFWINAYNAFTIKAIIDHYPVKSITHIKVPSAENVWKATFFSIGGKKTSLDQIENKILRVEFDEPRMHFAINCASISCPVLRNEAYRADRLDVQLTEQTERFFKDSTKNQISSTSPALSSIFDWFKSDFTKHGTLIDFINRYSTTKISNSAKISYMEYNWNLNE